MCLGLLAEALRLGLRPAEEGVKVLGFRTAFQWLITEVRDDRRMQISIVLGLVLAPTSIWLFRHLVAMGYDKFLVNIEISLATSVIWYFINRRLFADRQAAATRTASGSFAWWLISFGIHQGAFIAAVGFVGVPFIIFKGIQVSLQPPEFFAKYWFSKNKLFVSKTETA